MNYPLPRCSSCMSLSQVLGFTTPPPLCLRFDFNLTRPMSPIEVAEVEALVNGWVAAATPLQV